VDISEQMALGYAVSGCATAVFLNADN